MSLFDKAKASVGSLRASAADKASQLLASYVKGKADEYMRRYKIDPAKAGDALDKIQALIVDVIKGNKDKKQADAMLQRMVSSLAEADGPAACPSETAEEADGLVLERHNNGVVKVSGDLTPEQDDAFIDSLMSVRAEVPSTPLETGKAAMDMVNTLVTMSGEVAKFTELQKTRRAEIEAAKEVALVQIHARTQLLSDYLKKTFDERDAAFSKYFQAIDAAIEAGNVEMLAISLQGMNDLAKSSPFKNLADINAVQSMLTDKDTEFDF